MSNSGIESNFDGWGDVIDPPPHISEKEFEELVNRLTSKSTPIRQILLTTNPEPIGLLLEAFNLKKDIDGS